MQAELQAEADAMPQAEVHDKWQAELEPTGSSIYITFTITFRPAMRHSRARRPFGSVFNTFPSKTKVQNWIGETPALTPRSD